MDFEVVEMSDTMRHIIIEISRNSLTEPTAGDRFFSNKPMFDSSSINIGDSPMKHLVQRLDKKD